MTRVVICGAAGRMGRMLVRAALGTEGVTLAAAVGRGAAAVEGVTVTTDLSAALAQADVAIDFTGPAGTAAIAVAASEARVALVSGTTGLDQAALAAIQRAAERVPVVRSANMSLGVNLLVGLLQRAAAALPDFDLEIVELHHRLKADAPSGTALMLAAAAGRGDDLRTGRTGQVGQRSGGEIGVLAVRGGDVVGEHTAYLLGPGERLELTHRATSREIFAHGALRAARWVAGQRPGCYDMQDVLGLRP